MLFSSGVPEGSQFRYSEDGGATFHVLTSDGTNPVEVPSAYLGTLEFKAPENDDGTFNITVQAKTVDTDPDTGLTDTSISGNATLTLEVDPVADSVTLAVSSPARGFEDTTIPLDIRPTSSDDDESFEVEISDVPGGAVISYGGTELTAVDGKVTIENFDSEAGLSITPPSDSNEDFTLQVRSRSYEGEGSDTNYSDWTEQLGTVVKVAGVADPADITTVTPNEVESNVDSNDGSIPLDSVITTADLNDTDGSEVLNITLTGLDEQFNINGATFVGGTGTGRVWVIDSHDISDVTLEVPGNYSGTVNFKATPVTTENDGDSLTGDTLDLSVEVIPSPEAILATGTTVGEDTLGQVDFSIVQQNGETDETLSSVWISQEDVETADGYTLYFGNGASTTLQDAAGSEPNVILEDGYYKLTGDAINNIYVQGDPDENGSYELDVKYEITDPSSDGTLASVTEQFDATYTVNVNAVTDLVEIDLGTISTTGNATVSGIDVTATGNTVISVPFDILQVDDLSENNGPDVDGSETAIRLVIDYVPQGVTVVGGTYIGDSSDLDGGVHTCKWVLDLNEDFNGGGIPQTLEFALDGSTEQLAGLDRDITITVESQDDGRFIETGSVIWNLSTPSDFVSDSPATDSAAGIDLWNITDAEVLEDTPVVLGDLLNGSISVDSGDSGDFSIILTGIPDGAVVTGMESFTVDGQTLYTVSGTGDADLQSILDGITITASANSNSNNSGNLTFDATLTTWGPGSEENVQTVTINEIVTPVTDPAVVTIATPGGTEDSMIPITVTIDNPADGDSGSVVSNTLELSLGEDAGMGQGTLTYTGTDPDISISDNGNGKYTITGVDNGDSLEFTYEPAGNASGSVAINAVLSSLEEGASNVEITSESTSFEVTPVNDGYDLAVDSAPGLEDTLVEISVSGSGLTDTDGSEQAISAILENLPDGYLVYTGDSAVTAVLASNLGDDGSGNNTWSIPLENGDLPDFIGIQAPENFSGIVNGLELTVFTGENELTGVDQNSATFDLEITGVADGISLLTPTLSFGDEGELVPLNLNASLEDADGSETVNLTIIGAGEFAAFYDGSDNLLDTDYDAGTDTYTLTGIPADEVNDLSILQTAGDNHITITMETVETGSGDVSATQTGSFHLDISPVDTTEGDDIILFDSTRSYDGRDGTDTLQLRLGDNLDFDNDPDLSNLEVLDLGSSGGNHDVSNLALQDLLDITDGDNELFITGDSGDSVSLLSGTESQDVGGGVIETDQWIQSGTATVTDFNGTGEDINFDVYINTLDPTVTINIDQDITDLIIDG